MWLCQVWIPVRASDVEICDEFRAVASPEISQQLLFVEWKSLKKVKMLKLNLFFNACKVYFKIYSSKVDMKR